MSARLSARNILAAVNAAQRAPLTEDAAIIGMVMISISYTVVVYFVPRLFSSFARS